MKLLFFVSLVSFGCAFLGGESICFASTCAPQSSCEPSWEATFGAPGVNRGLYAFQVLDLGGGPSLYASGQFTRAGGVAASQIARWNGTSWSALGAGIGLGSERSVFTLAGFDDGSGLALYAGGDFANAEGAVGNRIARWDGESWTPLGAGIEDSSSGLVLVRALAVFDDGSGPALFAAGNFLTAGGVAANNVAKWNGTSWSPLGSGTSGVVTSLAVFDDGSGPALYAGGSFSHAGGVLVFRIARWNGTSWSAVGGGVNNSVAALGVFDDGGGGGPALYAGGAFGSAGGVGVSNIARWNGTSWSALGSGVNNSVLALSAFDDGSGPALFAGGAFTTAGGAPASHVARWDGTGWSSLGSGTDGFVQALAAFDDGGGAKLHVGGSFFVAGSLSAHGVAAWDGGWSNLDVGAENELLAPVHALESFEDGAETALYAGGGFTTAGVTPASHVARWDGTSWSALGSGTNVVPFGLGVRALEFFDDGSGGGPALHAGGDFTSAGGAPANRIAKWDGASWSPLGSGVSGSFQDDAFSPSTVHCLATFDDGSGAGPALHAGGNFTSAGGGVAYGIAKWDGLSWSPLRNGLAGTVHALAVFDDGAGAALYAGGEFLVTGGNVTVNHVARWDGTSWSPLSSGTNGLVRALAVYDDGKGTALYAGGSFTSAGGVSANRAARWDGTSWSPLGVGIAGTSVNAMSVFHDGAGAALYAGGNFTTAGGVAAKGIAKWNGASWSALGGGMETVHALASWNGFGGPTLFAGGSFLAANDSLDRNLARWQGCDTAAPTLACPGSLFVDDLGAAGEFVTFTVTTSDDHDANPTIVCTPPSGSFFPRGATRVTCSATDAAGNQTTCDFEVQVGKARRH